MLVLLGLVGNSLAGAERRRSFLIGRGKSRDSRKHVRYRAYIMKPFLYFRSIAMLAADCHRSEAGRRRY